MQRRPSWRGRRIRAALLLRQNAPALAAIALWFAGSTAVFAHVLGRGWREALLTTFYFREAAGAWGHFYRAFSEFVVFGMLLSVVVTGFHRRYRPEDTCRRLAAGLRDHAVVIGYSHLGQRVCEHLWAERRPG